MTFGSLPPVGDPPRQPRYFDEVDTVTGTPEADVFEVQRDGQIFFNPIITNEVVPLFSSRPWWLEVDTREPGQGRVIRKPGQGTAPPKEQPGSATQSLDDNFIAMGIPIIVDESTDSEVDILVYQEQERAVYLDGFQAPTARSYTYIEDFEPIEDSILVDGGKGHVRIMSDKNDIPMLSDVIEPSLGDIGDDFEYVPLFQ